ncbi:hypothetical protein F9K33_12045 [bacterium]|nr:MAG: hypothetical protein F9K33_12045 [bacterium]
MGNGKEPPDRQEYLTERKLLIELESTAASTFDKAMLTLSAGAIGLSITFTEKIASNPICKEFLYTSWCFLLVSLLAILSSFITSQHALREQRDNLDGRYNEMDFKEKTTFAMVTNILNWLSISTFTIGIIFLIIFAIKNYKN